MGDGFIPCAGAAEFKVRGGQVSDSLPGKELLTMGSVAACSSKVSTRVTMEGGGPPGNLRHERHRHLSRDRVPG